MPSARSTKDNHHRLDQFAERESDHAQQQKYALTTPAHNRQMSAATRFRRRAAASATSAPPGCRTEHADDRSDPGGQREHLTDHTTPQAQHCRKKHQPITAISKAGHGGVGVRRPLLQRDDLWPRNPPVRALYRAGLSAACFVVVGSRTQRVTMPLETSIFSVYTGNSGVT